MITILLTLISLSNAQVVTIAPCDTGARCYPDRDQYHGCRSWEVDPLPYCIVNGPTTPDLQIGYQGPCEDDDYMNNAGAENPSICVDCTTNSICATYTGLTGNTNSGFLYSQAGWISCDGNMLYTQYNIQCAYVAPYCDFDSGFASSGSTACFTPFDIYSSKSVVTTKYCYPGGYEYSLIGGETIASTYTSTYKGSCPYGLFCTQDITSSSWCLMAYAGGFHNNHSKYPKK